MEIIIKCEECNSLLDGNIGGNGILYVSRCPTCEKEIRDKAYDEGYEKGHDSGYIDGYTQGSEDTKEELIKGE